MSGVPFILTLLTEDAPALLGVFPPQWGIFDQDGNPIIIADSVDSIQYGRDYQISDYPQEQGAFESYNKVQVPFQAKIGFLISQTRTDFLNNIEQAVASLDLVSIITPEISYPSANLTHYGYRRDSRNGVTLIRVDVWCEEVRITAGQQVSSTSSQGQETAGVPSPIGQSNSISPGGALTTQSNNAAYPLSSGNVQPLSASSATPADLATGTGAFSLPQPPPI